MMRVAAGLDECPYRIRRLGLAQQDPMHAAAEDLTELPGIEPHIRFVGAVHRCLDDDRRRAMTGTRRAAIDHAAHVIGQASHVECAMFHADIHVVGPGTGIDATLGMGQYMAAVRAVIIDRLILLQQFDAATDPLAHESLL
jgi:hypothetical protein